VKVFNYHRMMVFISVALVLVVTGACRSEPEVATPFAGPFTGSPTAAPGVMVGQETVELTVSGGEFDAREIRIQQNVATMLFVVNEDDQAYVLRIGDLVVDMPIAAGETTEINFTTPIAEDYEAELLNGAGAETLDSIAVVVVPAGGTQ
jgi:hypothetical protein